ncbi:MAG: hypothetical protein WD226_11745 [Planctomycetota bacterium]
MSEFTFERGAERGLLRVGVPAACRYFEGHFADEPMLPAVAHFALADDVLGSGALDEPLHVAGVSSFRLRAAVRPGATLELRCARIGDSERVRWRVRSAARSVAEGVLIAAAGARRGKPPEPSSASNAAPLHAYLPQGGPALFIGELLEGDAEDARAQAAVSSASAFVRARDGARWFPSYLVVELGAQAAAAAEARQRRALEGPSDAAPRAGYLVRASDVRYDEPELPADAPLVAHAVLSAAAPPLRTWETRLELDGRIVASARVSTFAR